jgi:hypothetical protein
MSSEYQRGMTRRSLLRTIAAGSAAVAGGSLTTATTFAQWDQPAEEVDVTLTTSGWPYGAMPDDEARAADPNVNAYAEALQAWLDLNPGVRIEAVEFNIWGQQEAVTGLAGGTAPSFVQGNVIGSWDDATIRAAMSQGLVADVTPHLETYRFAEKLADYARPLWETWDVNGAYYAAPQSYNVGTGIHYRRDWIAEAGLEEPDETWTWDTVREIARATTTPERKGIALQSWGLGERLDCNGFELLTRVPAPDSSWNWQWDYTSMAEEWTHHIQETRAMVYEDQSVLADITFGDAEILNAFVRGEAGMHTNTVVFYSWYPTGAESIVNLETQLGKPLEEIVGWLPQPRGGNGYPGTQKPQIDLLAFSPDLDDEGLDKAVSLHAYMLGPGFVSLKQSLFETTQDPRTVYDYANITPVFAASELEGLPSSPDEAWGTRFMDAVRAAGAKELQPRDAWFLPAEETVGPTSSAMDDMLSRWSYEPGEIDIQADLQQLQDTRNQQADGFTSSVPDDEFKAAAREWYDALNAFFEANAPEFHQNVYAPWYDEKIVPAVSS